MPDLRWLDKMKSVFFHPLAEIDQTGEKLRHWQQGADPIEQKVNKVSVTALDLWGDGVRNFNRNLDKLAGVMSKAEVNIRYFSR